MLAEGLVLMAIGMGIVFAFLVLMYFCILITSKIIRKVLSLETKYIPEPDHAVDPYVAAAISAAVSHWYRKHYQTTPYSGISE